MTSRALLVLLLLGTSCVFDGDGDDALACTLIGCDSGAQFSLGRFPQEDLARFENATVEVCFAGACRREVIAELPPPNDIRELALGATGSAWIQVTLARTHASGDLEIAMSVHASDHELFTDGDIYSVTIATADGDELVNRQWSVTYRTWSPNGPRCGPTCRSSMTITEL